MPLLQLQLDHCELLGGEEGLAAALLLLPWLQHLSITECTSDDDCDLVVSSEVVQGLHQLTYLELEYGMLHDERGLNHLSGLQDLRLLFDERLNIDTDMLPSPQQLTRLQLRYVEREVLVPPAVLAGRTSLRHLEVDCTIDGGSAGVTELLSHLPQLQQLTHLSLDCSLKAIAPAAAYSALTASSNLRHLDVSQCTLPAGVWQYVFPAGRRLPELLDLGVAHVRTPSGRAEAPDCSRLVSCCPGLRTLRMMRLQYSKELLAALTGLSSLRRLYLSPADGSTQGLEVVSQLTRLQQLYLMNIREPHGLTLHLTRLRELTDLVFGVNYDSMQCKVRVAV
jgi:hypothetical protein